MRLAEGEMREQRDERALAFVDERDTEVARYNITEGRHAVAFHPRRAE
jgi:hypothetical protein